MPPLDELQSLIGLSLAPLALIVVGAVIAAVAIVILIDLIFALTERGS